jgi:hypothetical protein
MRAKRRTFALVKVGAEKSSQRFVAWIFCGVTVFLLAISLI